MKRIKYIFMNDKEIIAELKKHSNPKDREGMARFGINPKYALGVRVPVLRNLAKKIGKNHKLAQDLWKTKIHEARILASMIDDPQKVTEGQMEEWVKEFNSWDLCDQCCMSLFDKTSVAWKKAMKWAERKEEGYLKSRQTKGTPSYAPKSTRYFDRDLCTSQHIGALPPWLGAGHGLGGEARRG